jgi:acyl-CoA synthetase (AMP-forming)/AMP-acid ligase II
MADEVVFTLESTLPQLLKERCELTPDREALILGDERLTYGEFYRRVKRMAAVLHEVGVQPGEKVAVLLPNRLKFPVVMYAVFEVGGVLVSVNPTYTASEIKHLLNDSEAAVVIVAEKISRGDPFARIQEIRSELPHVRRIIVDGPSADPEDQLETLLEKAVVKDDYYKAKPEDLAALIYTSGTTGAPKGSMHTHRTLVYPMTLDLLAKPTLPQLFKMIRRYGFNYFKRLMSVARKPIKLLYTTPPFAGAGIVPLINFLLGGRTIVVQEHFSTTEAIQLIEKEGVTIFGATPALAALMLKDKEMEKRDVSSIIYFLCAASFVSPKLVREIRAKIGTPTMISYGCTEVIGGPTSTSPFRDSEKALRETVGIVTPGYEVKLVDDERKEVGINTVGEIALRSPSVMLGYYKDEDATRAAIDENGWYYTGDLGTFDEGGYLRIVGRKKDMIIRAGQNIYPAEVESMLITHPKISAASVVGVPDDIAGEKAVAFIIPESGVSLDQIEVLNFCRENMATFKVPGRVEFVDEFPMNPSGKVLKRILRDQIIAEMV